MKQSRQAGFTVVEVLLVLVFLAIIGFTGYYVWHAQKNTDKTLSDTGNSQTAKSTKGKSTTTSNNATVYMDIKEWGVKMPLTGDIKDAYYSMPSGSDFVTLSVESLKSTTCAADKISLGGIERFTADTKDGESGATMLSEHPDAVKVGMYYYTFEHTQAACGPDQATENKGMALETAFQQQAKYLQAN